MTSSSRKWEGIVVEGIERWTFGREGALDRQPAARQPAPAALEQLSQYMETDDDAANAATPDNLYVPPLTRLVRASALLAVEGALVGFALNTLRMWTTLANFAATNKMPKAERMGVLLWLIVPAVIWVVTSYARVLVKRDSRALLSNLEHWAGRNAWLAAIGLAPVLFHPTVWRNRELMFLLTNATAGAIAWSSIRLTQRAWRSSRRTIEPSQFGQALAFVKTALPLKLRALAPILIIACVVVYLVAFGVLRDPTAVPKAPLAPPAHMASLRQTFVLMGHGGWLGIPIAALQFLRPPSHAHVLFWAACVASAAFPIYAWARPSVGSFSAVVVALLYLYLPVLRTVGRADVLPLGIAAGAFFWTLHLWRRGHLSAALLAAVLTVGLHEQAALWFACVGLHMTRARSTASVGRWVAALAFGYFCLIAFVVLPSIGLNPYQDSFRGLWGRDAVGLQETLRVALTNPAYVLSRWIDRQELSFWLVLLVPFLFIPLASRYALLWLLPGILFGVVAVGKSPSLPVTVGATTHFVVLGLLTSVLTLGRLYSDNASRPRARAALIAWAYALIPCAYQLGALGVPPL
jgi:hypothetical protein